MIAPPLAPNQFIQVLRLPKVCKARGLGRSMIHDLPIGIRETIPIPSQTWSACGRLGGCRSAAMARRPPREVPTLQSMDVLDA